MPEPIDFYFDFSSPYGFIASQLVEGLAAKHGRTLRWRPVLLGAVFKTTGMAPLTEIPLKGAYVKRDFARTAKFNGVPFRMPDPFPFSGVAANRAFYWLDSTDPTKAVTLAHALYDAAFTQGRDIAAPDSVAEIAAGIGLDRTQVLAGIGAPETKERTRAENDAAMEKGVFGSPFLIIDGEPFWGVDRLDQAARWLETGGS